MQNLSFNINTKKNLLAFSAGVDSTALFFLLLEANIDFDIAIVDYNQRVQSKDEVIYATQLAHKYNKKCFISTYPSTNKFSEKDARDFRYNFFKDIIDEHNYEALITAHQLNDKLEWFLMQLTKGAGLSELLGIQNISYQDNITIYKPLLDIPKDNLQKYLEDNHIKYFIDDTNFDTKYKRNYFRKHFSNTLIKEFPLGIKNSFHYLQKDLDSLFASITQYKDKELVIFKYNGDTNIAIRLIDKELKKRGIIISSATRDEILQQKSIIISNIAVVIEKDTIYIAPKLDIKMDKKFKERCRVKKIPKNIRAYLYKNNCNLSFFS